MKHNIALILALLSMGISHSASNPEFKGSPKVKISEGGTDRIPEVLDRDKAVNLNCVISEIDGKHYWASRENKELVKMDGGAFSTYVAVDGSGYVRVIKPELKKAASVMGGTEARFDYVEHILIGLRSVTYYGNIN